MTQRMSWCASMTRYDMDAWLLNMLLLEPVSLQGRVYSSAGVTVSTGMSTQPRREMAAVGAECTRAFANTSLP